MPTRKKRRRKAVVIGIIIVVMVLAVGASVASFANITWRQPTPVYLDLAYGCTTETQSGLIATVGCEQAQGTHVADTWQVWNAYDGSGNILAQYSSDTVGINLPLTLVPSTTHYLTVSVPVDFIGALPTGSDLGGSYFTCIFVSEQATITLNGAQVGTIQPLATGGGPLLPSSFCSYTSSGTVMTLQFAIVISGTSYPSLPYTNPPLDLRSQIASLNSANVNVGAVLSQVWSVDKCYQQPRAAPGCTQQGGNIPIYTNYSVQAGINVASFTQGTISIPTQTAYVTASTNSQGQPVISIAQTISSISSVQNCGLGCTATLQFSGTTVNTEVTITPVNLPTISSLASLLSSLLSRFCGSAWYSQCFFGIPVWAWITLGVLLLVVILLYRPKSKRRGKRGPYHKRRRVTISMPDDAETD